MAVIVTTVLAGGRVNNKIISVEKEKKNTRMIESMDKLFLTIFEIDVLSDISESETYD